MDSKDGGRRDDDGGGRQQDTKPPVDSKQKNPESDIPVQGQRSAGVSSSSSAGLPIPAAAHSQLGNNVTHPSQPSGPSHSTQRGRQRRRERRRMNRASRREGSSYQLYGHQDRYRSRGDDLRWERDYDRDYGRHDRNYYQSRGSSRDHRGHHRGSSFLYGGPDYDYGSYSVRSRSRSPVSLRRPRSPSRSPSMDRSIYSRSQRSRSRSLSMSRSRSRSRSFEPEERDRSRSQSERGSGSRERRGRERKRYYESPDRNAGRRGRRRRRRGIYENDYHARSHRRRTHSLSSDSDASTSSSSSSEDEKGENVKVDTAFSKDQRTVFVSQLVMRATEKEIRRYFRRKVGCRVKEVILLKDKRTGSHKGCAYIEMGCVEDVNKAVAVAGQPPDFQRFPILIKASEAEKNYSIPASSSVVTASMMGTSANAAPFLTQDGKVVESQKVYVGGLDSTVSEEHLFALFSQFGQLEKVSMQMDPSTKSRRGFAFLSFTDPKVANLAIKTMSNQVLAGRSMKTGWASQSSSITGVDIVTSNELPDDYKDRAQKAFMVLAQLTGTSSGESASQSSSVEKAIDSAMEASTTEAAITTTVARAKEVMKNVASGATAVDNESKVAAASAVVDAKHAIISSAGSNFVAGEPTRHILVHNMFDKDNETELGWEKDLKEEFTDECSNFGKLLFVKVMWKDYGGKIYASFETLDSASMCAVNLAGRWFDKRQLWVEYVEEADIPK